MSLRLVRSDNEAYLYMELNPCMCGDPAIPTASQIVQRAGQLAVEYRGACRHCGRLREFAFRMPEDGPPVPENAWSSGTEPSELLDAGQWRWVADRLGSWPADLGELSPEQRQRALEDTAAAAAAIDEVLKFLPEDADEVPESAFWSQRGRQERSAEPGRFHRVRLEAARDGYRELAARGGYRELAAGGGPAGAAAAGAGAGAPGAAGAPGIGDSGPLPARSIAEAHLYMDLRPCVCGSPDFGRDDIALLDAPPGSQVLRWRGECDGCGRSREFIFQLPDRPAEISGFDQTYSFASDGPSALLDPAEWWAASQAYGQIAAEADQPGVVWSDHDAWQRMVDVLASAAAAVDEALRFLPGDLGEVPPTAIRSVVGREIYQASPGVLRRESLQALRAQRWERLADFVARHPEPEPEQSAHR